MANVSTVIYRAAYVVLFCALSQNLHSEPFYWRAVMSGSGEAVESNSPSGLCDAWVASVNEGIAGNAAGNYYERTGFAHATPNTDVVSMQCNAAQFAGPGSNFPEGHLIIGNGRSMTIHRRGNGCPGNAPRINGECALADLGRCDQQTMRGNPINVGSGNKYQREVDYHGPFGLRFVRHYNSRALSSAQEAEQLIGDDSIGTRLAQSGLIGEHWRHSYHRVLLKSHPRVGAKFEQDSFRPLTACQSCHTIGYPANYVVKIQVHLLRPDGRFWVFRREPDGQWRADEPHQGVLTEHTDGDGETLGWTFVNAQHEQEHYDSQGRLMQLQRRHAQLLSLTYDPASGQLLSVSDAQGHTLTFGYNNAGRIDSLTDTEGGVFWYHYDALGHLVGVTTPDLARKDYQYDHPQLPAALTAIFDENQDPNDPLPFARYGYEVFLGSSAGNHGRAVLSEHGDGAQRVTVDYDTSTVTEVIDAPRGVVSVTQYGFNRQRQSFLPAQISGDLCPQCAQAATTDYDQNGFVRAQTDANGHRTLYNHNDRGLEVSRTEAADTPDERIISTEWHPVYRLPTRMETSYQITEMTYNDQGDLLTHILTDNTGACEQDNTLPGCQRVTRYAYYAEGHEQENRLHSIDGPREDVVDITTYEYDNQGRLERVINALNQVTQIHQYNDHGRPTEIEDSNGVITQLGYDARQRLVTRTVAARSPAAATTTFDYYPNGTLQRITQPNGTYLHYHYDLAQRLTAVEDNLNNRIDYTLDNAGHRTQEVHRDPAGLINKTQTALYNRLSELEEMLGAEQQSTRYQYDAERNLSALTDPNAQVTTQHHDALNRLTDILDPENGSERPTAFDYDAHDNLTQVTDPAGAITQYTFNGFDELIEQNSPDTGTMTLGYDAAGNRISQTDARGVTVHFVYDALNRLTLIDYPGTIEDIIYTYDQTAYLNSLSHPGIGRLTSIEDHSGRTQYRYDTRANVVEHSLTLKTNLAGSTQGITVGFAYDAADNLIRITYPSGRTVNLSRDAIGQITAMTLTEQGQTQSLIEQIQYQPFGPMHRARLGNGLVVTQAYDLDGRLSQQSTAAVIERGYQYDPNSNIDLISALLDNSQGQTYSYDGLNRLTDTDSTNSDAQYAYDPVGNRLNKIMNSTTHTYQYDPQSHRLEQTYGAQTTHYQYDAAGNTIARNADAFTYYQANRLATATVNGDTAHYLYNAQGLRTLKTNSQGSTLFVYDLQGLLIAELNDQSDTVKEYVYLNGQPLAQFEPLDSLARYTVNNRATGLKLRPLDDSNGSPIIATASSANDAWVQYTLVPSSDDYVYLRNVQTGQYFRPSASEDGVGLEQRPQSYSGTRTQWRLDPADGEFQFLVNRWTGKHIRPDTDAEDGPIVQRPNSWRGSWTQWLLEPASSAETAVYYFHNDHLGSPQKLTNENQTVVWEAQYTPFGMATVNEDPDGDGNTVTQNIRFPGQYFDEETQLHYNWFRYYDPKIGRYITSDPIGLDGGINTYRYANQNPLIYIDPLGLMSLLPELADPQRAAGAIAGIECASNLSCRSFGSQYGDSNILEECSKILNAGDLLACIETCQRGLVEKCRQDPNACLTESENPRT